MQIISKFTVDNIQAAILEYLTTNPGWSGEDTIHQRICGSGAWEMFDQTCAMLNDLTDAGKVRRSSGGGVNHWSYRLA